MSRLRFTAALALALTSGTAFAEVSGEKPGFLASLLGLKSAQPDAPMAIHVAPAAKAKTAPGSAAPARPDAARAKAGAPKSAGEATAKEARPVTDKARSSTRNEPKSDAAAKKLAATTPIDPAPQAAPAGAAADHSIDPAAKPARKMSLGPFRGGGSQPVCVRTCDGFFFPVNYEGAHNGDRYAEACQSSCPAAKTEVYFMPRGADLKSAATARGERYTALPAAFRYRKERDATCTCKADSQSWGEVLAQVEPMIKKDKNEILVTAEKSAELARPEDPNAPKAVAPAAAPKKSAARKKNGKPAEAQAATAPASSDVPMRSAFSRDLVKGDPNGAWKNSRTFVKVDPEPTASITKAAQ